MNLENKTQPELRSIIKERILTQKQIAKEIGVDTVYFNLWLHGKKDFGKNKMNLLTEWMKTL